MKSLPYILVSLLCGAVLTLTAVGINMNLPAGKVPLKAEYTLEILNQDSVRVFSHSTKKTYTVEFDKVEEVLINDNL